MKKYVLKNGIKVIHEKRDTASVAVEISFNVGSIHEPQGKDGICHFIEHMLFEGTKKRIAQEITSEIESLGGEFNAETSREMMLIYIILPGKHFLKALDILSDMIKNPLFEEDTIRKEKKVIFDEIALVKDDPATYAWKLLYGHLFEHEKIRKPITGTKKTLNSLKRQDLVRFYKKYFVPNNMMISVAGKAKNVKREIEHYFGDMKRKPLKKLQFKEIRELNKSKRKVFYRPIETSYLLIGFKAPNVHHKDHFAVEVLRSVLGRGQSSRLFNEIRVKRGLSYSVGAEYEPYLNFGILGIYADVDKKNLKKVEKMILDELRCNCITAKDVKDATSFIEGNFILSREDNKARSEINAYYDLIKLDPKDYIKKIKRVTLKDVRRVAEKYFCEHYVTIAIQER